MYDADMKLKKYYHVKYLDKNETKKIDLKILVIKQNMM